MNNNILPPALGAFPPPLVHPNKSEHTLLVPEPTFAAPVSVAQASGARDAFTVRGTTQGKKSAENPPSLTLPAGQQGKRSLAPSRLSPGQQLAAAAFMKSFPAGQDTNFFLIITNVTRFFTYHDFLILLKNSRQIKPIEITPHKKNTITQAIDFFLGLNSNILLPYVQKPGAEFLENHRQSSKWSRTTLDEGLILLHLAQVFAVKTEPVWHLSCEIICEYKSDASIRKAKIKELLSFFKA